MIGPDEIRIKAARLYPQAVAAWLCGEEFFPRTIPANLKPSALYSDAVQQVNLLVSRSKQAVGYGYSLTLENRRSRLYGEQNFPIAITLDSREDLLRLIGKLAEFRRLNRAVDLVRERHADLMPWIQSHWKQLLTVESDLPALLKVVAYLKDNPRPGCFIRELPLAISTKLVESHAKLLAQWLDIVTPNFVDFAFDRQQFAPRYGFRAPDDQLWLRILDPEMLEELRCPGDELALPLSTLAALPVCNARAIVVENKINLLTLPPLRRTIALGGLGRAVTRLFALPWMDLLPITYWGDIDVEGLQILADVRHRWPLTQSFMMDEATLDRFTPFVVPGNSHSPDLPPPVALNLDEIAAFARCRDQGIRLEQERIPPSAIAIQLSAWIERG